jgi:hypothetical protein
MWSLLHPEEKYGFPCANLHKTHKYSAVLDFKLLYRISDRSIRSTEGTVRHLSVTKPTFTQTTFSSQRFICQFWAGKGFYHAYRIFGTMYRVHMQGSSSPSLLYRIYSFIYINMYIYTHTDFTYTYKYINIYIYIHMYYPLTYAQSLAAFCCNWGINASQKSEFIFHVYNIQKQRKTSWILIAM